MKAFTFFVFLFAIIFLFSPKGDHGKVTVFYEDCTKKSFLAPSDPMPIDTSFFVTYPSMGMSYVSYGTKCGFFPKADSIKVRGVEILNTQANIIAFRLGNNVALQKALDSLKEKYILN